MRRLFKRAGILTALFFGALDAAGADSFNRTGWPAYQGGPDHIHYSSLTQINRGNVADLEVAWTLDTGGDGTPMEMYCNPIVIGRVMYVLSPDVNLVAADAATGREIWRFDPFNGKRALGRHRVRGVTYWSDGSRGRILFAARHYLYAIDTRTGRPIPSFGTGGRIDLREHLDRDPASQTVSLNTPGVIYKDLLIIGSTVSEMFPAAYGDIRAYNVRTGKLVWKFHTIPRPGEYGYETWPKDAWKHTGGVNSWAGMSLDEKRGIVFAPTGSATYDWHSSDRAGDNLFANTLLALDAATGKRIWHFQTIHHDSWDRDLPSAPSIVSVMRNGKRVDAVAQPTKTGHLFVFDRVSGAPLFPIEERKVPTEAPLGEVLSPTQPFPTLPEPFARQVFTEGLVTDRTSQARAAVIEIVRSTAHGDPFIPVSQRGTLVLPGVDGGAEWGGAAWDPETGLLYINANDVPWYVRMKKREALKGAFTGKDIYTRECTACHGADRKGSAAFPSLESLGKDHARDEVASFIYRGSGRMPAFSRLGREAVFAVTDYLLGRDSRVESARQSGSSPQDLEYTAEFVKRLHDPDGYPGIKPPWGTLSAIDLNTGKYAWQVPLGEYPELAAKGMKDTGSENYGGATVTAGGLVFIGATIYDRKFRAFDKLTGRLLWETVLPAAGHSTPTVYEIDGRQFVVIAAGGGKGGALGDNAQVSSGQYIAFALPLDKK